MTVQLANLITMIFATFFSALGSFYMKKGSGDFSLDMRAIINAPLTVGVTFHGVAAVLTILAYRNGDLTVLVPLISLNYVWASFLAVKYLDERFDIWKLTGMLGIILGVALVGIGGAV